MYHVYSYVSTIEGGIVAVGSYFQIKFRGHNGNNVDLFVLFCKLHNSEAGM